MWVADLRTVSICCWICLGAGGFSRIWLSTARNLGLLVELFLLCISIFFLWNRDLLLSLCVHVLIKCSGIMEIHLNVLPRQPVAIALYIKEPFLYHLNSPLPPPPLSPFQFSMGSFINGFIYSFMLFICNKNKVAKLRPEHPMKYEIFSFIGVVPPQSCLTACYM